MAEKEINNYILYKNDDGYIIGFGATLDAQYDYTGQMSDYPEACEGWYKFINGKFVVDEEKKAEIIAEREAEAKKPTWQETIESQVYYTALLTDSIIDTE